MAKLSGFNANKVKPHVRRKPISRGDYIAVITDSSMKPTRAGTGEYLELKFKICEEPHEGRVLLSRLNLDNPNEVAVQIAQEHLSAICFAVGVPEPEDSSELHDLPLMIHVELKQRKDNLELTNEITGYAAVGS